LRQIKPKMIGSSLKKILDSYGLLPRMKQYEIVNSWNEIVGEQISRVTKAEKMIHGTLIVRVEKPVWRNELLFLKKEIIAKINEIMKDEIVKDIIFK
jgi:predicted nucleic acid-binding Zn ribbon protein